jgi:hypothetical protein
MSVVMWWGLKSIWDLDCPQNDETLHKFFQRKKYIMSFAILVKLWFSINFSIL